MVCPPGDTISTEVGLGPKIDLVGIFFVKEEKRDAETESFLSVAVSRASLSVVEIPLFVLAAFRSGLFMAGAGGVRS
jgi:hypothetical protein